MIRNNLINQFLKIKIDHYGIQVENQDKGTSSTIADAMHSLQINKIGMQSQQIKYSSMLQNVQKDLEDNPPFIKDVQNRTVFKEPIICKNIPISFPTLKKTVLIGQHQFDKAYRPILLSGNSDHSYNVVYEDKTGKMQRKTTTLQNEYPECQERVESSIRRFAAQSFKISIMRNLPLYLSTFCYKRMDRMYKNIFDEVYKTGFEKQFNKHKLFYKVANFQDFVSFRNELESGGFVIACSTIPGTYYHNLLYRMKHRLALMMVNNVICDSDIVITSASE